MARIQLVDLCGARCGDKGDMSDLASASLRCASVIPSSSSASMRSSSTRTIGSIVASPGSTRTSAGSSRGPHTDMDLPKAKGPLFNEVTGP